VTYVVRSVSSVAELPNVPAVYAMYGGRGRSAYVAYVGIGERLKQRLMQHLVGRNSSVTTGTSAASLNVDQVSQVQWWEHPDFSESHKLVAAELVAFDVLDPALRSRGAVQDQARRLYQDQDFYEAMRRLFTAEPSGRLVIPNLIDALERISRLEQRLSALETKLASAEVPRP
jgi:hypothetical protein